MNRVFSVMVITGLLFQTFSSALYFAGYLFKKKYISTVLCEQKEIDSNSCQGKCHLKKQITKNEQQKESKEVPVKKNIEMLFYTVTADNNHQFFSNRSLNYMVQNRFRPNSGFPTGVFHPPALFFS